MVRLTSQSGLQQRSRHVPHKELQQMQPASQGCHLKLQMGMAAP